MLSPRDFRGTKWLRISGDAVCLCLKAFSYENTNRTRTIVGPPKADLVEAGEGVFFQALYECFQSDISHMTQILNTPLATFALFGAVLEEHFYCFGEFPVHASCTRYLRRIPQETLFGTKGDRLFPNCLMSALLSQNKVRDKKQINQEIGRYRSNEDHAFS